MDGKLNQTKLRDLAEKLRGVAEQRRSSRASSLLLIFAIRFVPPGLPLPDVNSDYVRYQAFTDDAPNGYWEVTAWDYEDCIAPAAKATFLTTRGLALCELLSVEDPYRGRGVGQQLIELGSRLLGQPVHGSDEFYADNEDLWWSMIEEEEAA
jgi:GNAT superfamily N-acetyltransferase